MTRIGQRKEQIKAAAKKMFRERGFAATSMRELAKEVGIEPASLYNHISSKEELLSDITFELAESFFIALQPMEKLELPPDQKLAKYIAAHVSVITSHPDAAVVFLHEWRFLNEEKLDAFKLERSSYQNKFAALIQLGIEQGRFEDINIKFYMLTLFSSMNWIYDWYREDGSMDAIEIAKRLTDLFFEGIRKN